MPAGPPPNEQVADASGAAEVLFARRRGGNAVRDYLDYRITPDLVYAGVEG